MAPDRLETAAHRLATMAGHAAHRPRAIAYLAALGYVLAAENPAGAARSDSRSNCLDIAACLASSANWSSGNGAMPGRQVTAALVGKCEKTWTRHVAILVREGFARVEQEGRATKAAERSTEDDPYRLRKVIDLPIPQHRLQGVTDVQIWPFIKTAIALFDGLFGRVPVDNFAGRRHVPGTVTPPPEGVKALSFLSVARTQAFSTVLADEIAAHATREESRPGGRGEEQDRPSGSSTKSEPTSLEARTVTEAGRLAFLVVTSGLFPGLGTRDIPKVAGRLRGLPRWTLRDLVAERDTRLTECRQPLLRPSQVTDGFGYFCWLMAKAIPSEPPAQIRDSIAAAARALHMQGVYKLREQVAEREAAAVPASNSAAYRAARAALDERVRQRKAAAATRTAAPSLADVEWPEGARPGGGRPDTPQAHDGPPNG
ncbi:MAG: hypothetical protein HOV96_19370 [Nonomuraea sp.]|nr:hypothetical protein [Nonomuraea sp.]